MEDDHALGSQLIFSGNTLVAGPPFSILYSLSILPSLDFLLSSFSHYLSTLQTKHDINSMRLTQPLQGVPRLMYTIVQLGPY